MSKKEHHKQSMTQAGGYRDLMPQDDLSVRILRERAALLAQVEIQDDPAKEFGREYIKFKLGQEELYGIPYADVADVKGMDSLTKVPNAPDYVLGVHYWHGKIIPVIDLSRYFGIESVCKLDSKAYLATVIRNKFIIGFSFDDVVGSDIYLENKIDPNIMTGSRIKEEYVYGIHSGNVVILNIKCIVDDIARDLLHKEVSRHE